MSYLDTIVPWIAGLTGQTVIQAYQNASRPALPYVMANLTGEVPLTQHPARILRTGTDEEPTDTIITDLELRVSVHAYGDDPLGTLRAFAGIKHLPDVCAPLGAIRLQEVGRAEFVPELVGADYEPRAVLRLIFHAPTTGVHPGSVVETAPVTVIEESSQ